MFKIMQDGDIDIALRRENNVDGMAQAAGVEDLQKCPLMKLLIEQTGVI